MFLRCSNPDCATPLDADSRAFNCPRCGDLVELCLGPSLLDPASLKRVWLERRMSRDPRDRSGVWRFREFLPTRYLPHEVVTLGEGNVPLVRGMRTAQYAEVSNLHFKHLGWNPTACFKDLGMTVGVTEARHRGAQVVACASTGNTAGSMAAYAARAGITARVYLPAGAISQNKLAQSLDYGAEVVEIEGNFDAALDHLLSTKDTNVYFLNSVNPYRIEGQKTVMFELMEQLDWEPPDYIVVPGGNLGNVSAFGKGLQELRTNGFIDYLPRLIVVQAEGANPLVRTWESGAKELQPIASPNTAATAIRIGNPKSWKKAVRALQLTGGTVLDVTEDEIAEAKAMIGRDGVGCEPASATTLAGIRKLVRKGTVDSDAMIVAILTGHVLKDTDYILRSQQKQVATEVAEMV